MSFPNAPREIEEQARFRDEANKRFLLAMQPYHEEFLAAQGRKELLEAIEKTDDDFAFAVSKIANFSLCGYEICFYSTITNFSFS